MGVTSLWQIVSPCARPVKIDTLNKKRLSVDASIWVYHFLKAVRDKEGNALRNSHIVGFYRRICKLLYYGIKPVFVFDGGAPALKRQTINSRKARREGRREDAVRTAGKLLALQMQRRAEEDEQRRLDAEARNDREEAIPDNPVYVDELNMTQQERQQSRKFKKRDQYHLPDLDVPLAEMGGPNDPRVMSLEELQTYARQFEEGEDINVYDFSKIDFDSPFFTSLPATDRYNILNAARLRSRLRMGYSREQLEQMFPDRMEFSRFQIERVRERNELTQRLMRVGTVEDGTFSHDGTGRVAGEKGREYVLVKNPDVEGGWALGVIGDKDEEGTDSSRPIDIEAAERKLLEDQQAAQQPPDDGSDADDNWEEVLKRREAFYKSRRINEQPQEAAIDTEEQPDEDEDALFVPDATQAAAQPDAVDSDQSNENDSDDEEAQLQIALAMSMEAQDQGNHTRNRRAVDRAEKAQRKAPEGRKFAGSRFKFANMANRQAQQAIVKGRPLDEAESDGDDGDEDLQQALAESRRKTKANGEPTAAPASVPEREVGESITKKAHGGPLPFEKLDLGASLLGKKKIEKMREEEAGGFEKKDEAEEQEKKKSAPAPPWFSADADVQQGISKQREMALRDNQQDEEATKKSEDFNFQPMPSINRRQSNEIIDVDAEDEKPKQSAFIDIDSSDEEATGSPHVQTIGKEDNEIRMGDIADAVRAQPPLVEEPEARPEPPIQQAQAELPNVDIVPDTDTQKPEGSREQPKTNQLIPAAFDDRSSEELDWSESERGKSPQRAEPNDTSSVSSKHEAEPAEQDEEEKDEDEDDEDDIYIPTMDELKEMDEKQAERDAEQAANTQPSMQAQSMEDTNVIPASGTADQAMIDEDFEEQPFSDPEDEELMANLADEAEEHARFASSFNNKTTRQNIEEYEKELKALRSQQKKDRRDADEVTQVMIQECQQLLKLFGLPYITAPMEAEAQCAELVSLGLVDGIVTDDSDVFLFGGTRVYKNMFNQAQSVECYLASDLERDFDLTRERLISIAHLLGSDYTEGLHGVGPVNAVEILTEFPTGLEDFRDWFTSVQTGQTAPDADRPSAFRKKFRKQATKLTLPPGFPDRRVGLAYTNPDVDHDPSPFQWGVPDLPALRAFLMATIGWDQARTDEVLVPVIRDTNRREAEGTQANITSFLGATSIGAGAFAPRVRAEGKSRRMESALERLAERARAKKKAGAVASADPVQDEDGADAVVARAGSALDGTAGLPAPPAKARKRDWSRRDIVGDADEDEQSGADEDEGDDEGAEKRQKQRTASKRKRGQDNGAVSGEKSTAKRQTRKQKKQRVAA